MSSNVPKGMDPGIGDHRFVEEGWAGWRCGGCGARLSGQVEVRDGRVLVRKFDPSVRRTVWRETGVLTDCRLEAVRQVMES